MSRHPGGNLGANLESISHKCYLREIALEWELTNETIYFTLGCLQGGIHHEYNSSPGHWSREPCFRRKGSNSQWAIALMTNTRPDEI